MDIVAVLQDAVRAGIGVPAAAYAIAAVGLNLHFGYTGLLNFGHVGFFLMGAYGTALTVEHGGSLWLGLPMGMLAAVLFGLLLGLPTLRLRSDYLAIVTIAAAEILRRVFRAQVAEPVTNGVFGVTQFADPFYGLNPIPVGSYGFGRLAFSHRVLWVMLVGWALVLLVTLVLVLLSRSPWGRVLRAVREDEDAARSLGKNAFWYKLQSLLIGGVMGGLAGMLLAIDTQAVNPDTYLVILTFFVYTALILGGTGSMVGPIVGAMLFWFVLEFADGFLRGAIAAGWIPGGILSTQDVAAIRFSLVGLGLMLLMVFRPQGMFGKRREMVLGD